MIYTADIVTPSGTLKTAIQKSIIKVTKGLVYKINFLFPPGSTGLLYCLVTDGNHQVWPSTPGQFFRGDSDNISFEDTYLKLSPPYEFDIYTYNLDEAYDHSVIINIGMVSGEVFMARFLPTYTYDHFMKLLAKTEQEQLIRQQELIKSPFSWVR